MNYIFSDKVKDMKPSAIREIFKSLQDPNMISLAAGNPSELSFPVEQMGAIAEQIFLTNSTNALQYSVTEGYMPLRKQITRRLSDRFGIDTKSNEVIVTTGGQQGIDLFTKILCNEGDTVICENPSFIGALNAFRSYNLNLIGVDMESDGISLEMLESKLKTTKNVKFIYLIPTFQNPSGVTMSLEKRIKILELAEKYNVMILEDNPYGELRFDGTEVKTLKSLDTAGCVLYCSSFSKILSAGMRIGYICGAPEIIQKIVVVKQVNDVHTNIFFQMLVSQFIETYGLDDHIEKIKKIYRHKADLMTESIDKIFENDISYIKPQGGLFIWATLPNNIDSALFAKKAISNMVAVVSGNTFEPNPVEINPSFRLNYSMPNDEQIVEGIKRLKKTLDEM